MYVHFHGRQLHITLHYYYIIVDSMEILVLHRSLMLTDSIVFDCITVHLPNKFMHLVGISFQSGMASGEANNFCCIHFSDVSTDEKLSVLTAQRIQCIRDCCCEWA